MAINDDLLKAIDTALGSAVAPGLSTSSAISDLFEAYIFGLVVKAAQAEKGNVEYYDVHGSVATTFVFRTSPGQLFSAAHPYTYASIEFPGKELLEAHVGVRVAGKSTVLHELDVCVLTHAEATTSRLYHVPPRSRSLELAIECKYYTTNLALGLARSFIGLDTDLSTTECFFVSSNSSESVEALLTSRARKWDSKILPANSRNVERLRNAFQIVFQRYKARR